MFSQRKKYKVEKSLTELEPEEIFLDSQKKNRQEKGEETEGRIEPPLKKRTFIILGIILTFVFLVLLSRVSYLQVFKSDYYLSLAESNRIRIYPLRPPRAIIYSSSGEQLVENVPTINVLLEPQDLPKDLREREEVLENLSTILGEPVQDLLASVKKFEPLILVKNLDYQTYLILKSKIQELPGVRIEEDLRRNYLNAEYFSHLLGYCGLLDEKDLEIHPDYYLTDSIGKTGLENEYESILRGRYGKLKIEKDALGNIRDKNVISQPKLGGSLSLFLQGSLQIKIYDVLKKTLEKTGSKKGAALVMDPKTGGILALVSFPTYDNNLFAKGISFPDYQKLISDQSAPLFNRVISGGYPSGSVIKPLIAGAVLEEKIVTPWTIVNCPGYIQIGNYKKLDWKAHGITSLIKAIAQSCNVYFYTVGGGYGSISGLGEERIGKYLKEFGWGKRLNIDLPEEFEGFIPGRQEREEKGEKWYLGDTYNLSIGQGELKVTPLQITAAISAIANGGILYQPQVVDKVLDAEHKEVLEDIKPRIINQNFLSQENINWVRKGMREAVISGSSRYLFDLPIKVAGKTGTAQFGSGEKTHAWFSGFAPYDNPEIVLTILIEGGGEGSTVAVPAVKEIFKWYFSQ